MGVALRVLVGLGFSARVYCLRLRRPSEGSTRSGVRSLGLTLSH